MSNRRHPLPQNTSIREIINSGLCPKCRRYGTLYAHRTESGAKYSICNKCGYRYRWTEAKKRPRKVAKKTAHAKAKKEMTLADHAEAWLREKGIEVPPRGTAEWDRLYKQWHRYAFASFPDVKAAKTDHNARVLGLGKKKRFDGHIWTLHDVGQARMMEGHAEVMKELGKISHYRIVRDGSSYGDELWVRGGKK